MHESREERQRIESRAGDCMRETICVLDVNIDYCSAKQALKQAVEYMGTPVTNVINLVTIEALMYAKDEPAYRLAIGESDLVLPGQKDILEAADIRDSRFIRETESQTFLRLYLRYLHRNHGRVYLLLETDEGVDTLTSCLAREYRGIEITGAAKVASESDTDDMLLNAINGSEADCVIACLAPPLQEEFISRNRSRINTRLWLGTGKLLESAYEQKTRKSKAVSFLKRMFFRREIEKQKRG